MAQRKDLPKEPLSTGYFNPSFFFVGYAVLSFTASVIFCWVIIIHGSTGLSLDLNQKGFYVSAVKDARTDIQEGDFIQKVNAEEHEVLLHSLFHSSFAFFQIHKFTVLRDKKLFEVDITPHPLSISDFVAQAFPFLTVILILTTLSLAAYFRAPGGQPAHIFLVSMISFSLSTTADLPLFFGVIHPGFVSIIYFLTLISGWIAFSSWAHFVLRYPVERDFLTGRPLTILLIYIIPPLASCLLAFIMSNSTHPFFSQLSRLRNVTVPFIIFGTFGKHVYDVVTTSNPMIKNQLVSPLIISVFGISPYLFLYALPSLFVDHPLISANLVTVLAMSVPFSLFISIIRYRLFDIHEMVSKIVSYIVFIAILSMSYAFFIAGLKRWFFGRAILSEEVFLLFMIGIMLIFAPVISRLEKLIDRIFYRHRPVPSEVMHEISAKITTSLHLSDLLKVTVDDLPIGIGITKAALILVEENQLRCHPENEVLNTIRWPKNHLFTYFKTTGEPYLYTHLPENIPQLSHELSLIKDQGFSLVLPLTSTLSQPGFMLIGHRKDGRFFRKEDLYLFSSLANQVALGLENAMRYETLVKSKKQLEELFSQKVQKEKMALVGEMSTMLAHELKNPLGIIHSSVQYIEKGLGSEKIKKEMIQYIKDEVEYLSNTVTSLLGMARQLPPVLAQIDLNQELPKLVHRWKRSPQHHPGIEIHFKVQEHLPVMYADLRQLTQVIHNLINNAEEMMTQGGIIDIEAGLDKKNIQIDIKDTGPGILEENMENVFQTFFTTKKKGLGLGLAVCRQIVSAHNGSLQLINRKIKGVCASIRLPLKPLATGATTLYGHDNESATDLGY